MTRVYFIRHGESDGNVNKYFQGQLDMPLTSLGEKQAELTAEYFKNIPADIVYSSDLKRTMHTAAKIAHAKEIKIIPNAGLREINAGLWQGVQFSDLAENDPSYKVWLTDIGNAVCPSGETLKQLQMRVNKAVNKIVSEHKGQKIIIVTHGGPIRALSCIWNNIPLSGMKDIPWVPNSSVTTIDYDDNNTPHIIETGYDKHLGEISTIFGANV